MLVYQRYSAGNFYDLGYRAWLDREVLRCRRANLQHYIIRLSGTEPRSIHFDTVSSRGQQLEPVKTCVSGVRGASPALFLARDRHLCAFHGGVRLIGDGALKRSTGRCLSERVAAPQAKKQKPNEK